MERNCARRTSICRSRVEPAEHIADAVGHRDSISHRIDAVVHSTHSLQHRAEHLRAYSAVSSGSFAFNWSSVAWWRALFDIEKTMVSLFEADRGRFVALDEQEIGRVRLSFSRERGSVQRS